MTPRIVRQWLTRVGLVGGATLVLAGCPEDAADITEQASEPSFNFPVASAFVEPVGEFAIDNLVLAAFDPDLDPDAFGRGGEDFGFGFSGSRYLIDGAGRNSAADSRLPALGGLGTEEVDTSNACRFGDDNFWGGPVGAQSGWDFFCFLQNMRPNTDYTVMLVRYSLTVNGESDTEEMLLDGTITDPDQLSVLGGTPGGYPEELCDFDPARPTFTTGVTGDQNPLVMGFATSNGSGDLLFDCLIGANAFWAGSLDGADPSLAPFAPNDIGSFNLPRYNYVVILEGKGTAGSPVPAGDHALRFQVGVDIDASGNPVNNGLAPLPNQPATDDELLAGPGGAGRPDSLSMTFNNLEALSGSGRYEAWLVNPETGNMIPALGDYQKRQIEIELDPVTGEVVSIEDTLVVESTTGTASFVGDASGQGFRHDLILSDNTLAPDTLGLFNYLVLTTTSSPGGSTIPSSRPFWFQFTDQNGTPDNFFDDAFNLTGGTSFGNFNPSDASASRVYIGVGQGTGGVRALDRDAATGLATSGILSVDLQALSRPPVGYELRGWVVSEDGSQAFPTDPITGPGPEFVDITTADAETIEGIVTQNGILNANFRLNSAEAGVDFTNFFNFMVTLEPKAGIAGMGPIPVQSGVLPGEVTTPVGGEE